MFDAIAIAASGLAAAGARLENAAGRIASAGGPGAVPLSGAPITGAVAAPSGTLGDPAEAILDLMTAELAYRLNVATLKAAADMVRSLYDAID